MLKTSNYNNTYKTETKQSKRRTLVVCPKLNNRTSLLSQMISRHLRKQVTLVILTLLNLTPRIYFW